MSTVTGSFTVTKRDSMDFAALSGDVNPLHVDSSYARRLQFGSVVVHGIHHLLRALDHAFDSEPALDPCRVTGMSVSFPNPVRLATAVEYRLQVAGAGTRAELIASADGLRVLTASIDLSADTFSASDPATCQQQCPPREAPTEQRYPPAHRSGDCGLYCDEIIARRLFPRLLGSWGNALLAQALACTRVVGMKCPGMHSVFSGLELALDVGRVQAEATGRLAYEVILEDARFQMVRISVKGDRLAGHLDAFFRPPPTAQPAFPEVRAKLAGTPFAGCHALVIGGSRGVGETTAKLLAAGGATVTISYHRGRDDALAVTRELGEEGATCNVLQLDVTGELSGLDALRDADPGFTHVFVFASPPITANRGRAWSPALFNDYCLYYVDAFARVVEHIMSAAPATAQPVTFFYPSSVFVETPHKGFAEYACAKAAGEALCAQLSRSHPNARFLSPRLPRMSTDQTSSVIPLRCDSTLEVMLRELARLSSA